MTGKSSNYSGSLSPNRLRFNTKNVNRDIQSPEEEMLSDDNVKMIDYVRQVTEKSTENILQIGKGTGRMNEDDEINLAKMFSVYGGMQHARVQ